MLPPWRMQALLSMQCVLNRSFLASRLRSNLVMDSTLPAIIIITITGNIIMVSVVMLCWLQYEFSQSQHFLEYVAIFTASHQRMILITSFIFNHLSTSANKGIFTILYQTFIVTPGLVSGLSFIIFSYLHVGKCAFGDSTLNNNEL